MPRWLLPWVVPLLLAVALVLAITVGTIALVVIFVIFFVGIAALRVQHLKKHPPDPELVNKPFWKL